MNPFHELLRVARETARELVKTQGTLTYKGDDGTTIEGWSVKSLRSWREDDAKKGPRAWETDYGDVEVILAKNGKLYLYDWHYQDYGPETSSPGKRTTVSVKLAHTRDLVGQGRPFGEMKGLLERMRWL